MKPTRSIFATAGVLMGLFCAAPALAQDDARWAEAVDGDAEQALQSELIRALREEDWVQAAEIAEPRRGTEMSGFTQYQAFFYAMTGRSDLVAAMQEEGRLLGAPACEGAGAPDHRDAVEAIVEAAEGHRAVMLQELHWETQHRLLLSELLPRLRELGFTHFAAEDFEGDPEGYNGIAYPRAAPGFHSVREPVFADAVRRAIALGYDLVPYEAVFPPPEGTGPREIPQWREDEQARHLNERIFAPDPDARALIVGGVSFAKENVEFPGYTPMLVRLKEISGVDPVSVDPSACRLPEGEWASGAAVPVGPEGEGIAPGAPEGAYDFQARYVAAQYPIDGRAGWLETLGRKPVAAPASLLPDGAPVIIEARPAGEPDDAAPMDRLYLAPGERLPLMLPPGAYRIRALPGGAEPVALEVD